MQDVDSSHKFHRCLTKTRSAPLAVFSLMHADGPSLSKGGVRLGPQISARSLERSSSSSPNRFGGFHHHACMQACRFGPAHSPAGSHRPIVQNRLVALFLHSILNVLAQRSHKLRDRFHIARVGTMLGPKFSNSQRAARFSHYPSYD